MGTNSGKCGTRTLQAESVGSRVESTRGCVKLKTVAEIRRSSARDAFIYSCDCFYLAQNASRDWEPVERLKRRRGVVKFTFFCFCFVAVFFCCSCCFELCVCCCCC